MSAPVKPAPAAAQTKIQLHVFPPCLQVSRCVGCNTQPRMYGPFGNGWGWIGCNCRVSEPSNGTVTKMISLWTGEDHDAPAPVTFTPDRELCHA